MEAGTKAEWAMVPKTERSASKRRQPEGGGGSELYGHRLTVGDKEAQ